MPRTETVNNRPTVAQEMSRFKGFATTDGEMSNGAPTQRENESIAANQPGAKGAAVGEQKPTPKSTTLTEDVGNEHETPDEIAAAAEAEKAANETPEETATRHAAEAAAAAKPNKLTVQQRINQAVGRQRAAERERDAATGALAAYRAATDARLAVLERGGTKPLTSDTASATSDVPGAPKPSDFEFGELDARYIRALARFEAKQELQEQNAQRDNLSRQNAQQQERAEMQTKAAAFEQAGSAKYDDFAEVVLANVYRQDSNPGGWVMSDTLGKLVLDSPVGYEIAYHLASDIEESRKVIRLTPMQQAAYFGRLEAKFSSASDANQQQQAKANGQQQAPVKTTQAPALITKARGSSAKTTVTADTNDFAAFEALAMARGGGARH